MENFNIINSNATAGTETYHILRTNLGSLFDLLDDRTLKNIMDSVGNLLDNAFERGQENV